MGLEVDATVLDNLEAVGVHWETKVSMDFDFP